MKISATVVMQWWPEPKWGRCRVEWWVAVLGDKPGWRDRISMGGPLTEAIKLADSVYREATEYTSSFVRGHIDELDTGWQERRYPDGHRRFVRTFTYEDQFG